jgi:hypothetical protein
MKSALKSWFVGFWILAPAALFPAVTWLFSEIDALWFTDHRPPWWSFITVMVYLAACVLIPWFSVTNAKQCLRELTQQRNDPDYYTESVSEIRKEK